MMAPRERIAELESEFIFLRRMIEGSCDDEIRLLARQLMTVLAGRIAALKREL